MIDWTTLIRSLNLAGLTQREIAKRAGVSFSTVQKLSMGIHTQPRRFESCLALLDLHYEHAPERHTLEVIGR